MRLELSIIYDGWVLRVCTKIVFSLQTSVAQKAWTAKVTPKIYNIITGVESSESFDQCQWKWCRYWLGSVHWKSKAPHPTKAYACCRFDALKENLEENEILLQCDYSENYKNLTKSNVHTVDIHASVSARLAVIIGQKEWSTNTQ